MGGVRAAARAAGWLCCGSLILAAPGSQAAPQLVKLGEFSQPTYATGAPGDASRVFVVERAGRVRVVRDGVTQAAPFLDVSSITLTDDTERGLLSMAFAPDYATSGRFYVYLTVEAGGRDRDPRVRALGEPGRRRSGFGARCC